MILTFPKEVKSVDVTATVGQVSFPVDQQGKFVVCNWNIGYFADDKIPRLTGSLLLRPDSKPAGACPPHLPIAPHVFRLTSVPPVRRGERDCHGPVWAGWYQCVRVEDPRHVGGERGVQGEEGYAVDGARWPLPGQGMMIHVTFR